MTCRATRRERVLISRGVHPHYRATTRTYFSGGLELEEIPLVTDGEAAGTTDLAALERMLADPDRPVAGVIAAQPDFLGLLEPMPEIGRLAHAAGALFVAVIEPVSLAVLAPPGAYGADIAAGEGQPLGIAPQYGGPYLGILASTDALVRQIPGRLVGMTTDLDGKRAFVMTHARARAGHPPRQGGQQHLHEPGAARARRVDLPRDDRSARAARRRGARRRARRRARGGPGGGRRRRGSIPVRTSTSSSSGSRTRGRGPPPPARPRASWPAWSSPTPSPTTRPSPTACSCARPRSPPRDEIARVRRRALGGRLPGATTPIRRRPGPRDERHGRAAPADALRARPARPRRRQDPAPAQGRARPPAGRGAPRGRRRPCPR